MINPTNELNSDYSKDAEVQRLRQQLATVTEQRDRAWAALLALYEDTREGSSSDYPDECPVKQAESVLAEARENSDGR